MSSFRAALLSAGIASLITASAAAAPVCHTPVEKQAVQVRQLQTELMVAALTCARHPGADLTSRYNRFVRKFGNNLVRNAEVLRGHFRRHHGNGEAEAFDGFITDLANRASMRSLAAGDFCEKAAPRFDEVLALREAALESYASRHVPAQDVVVCR